MNATPRRALRACALAAAALMSTVALVELAWAQDSNQGEIDAARNVDVSPQTGGAGEDAGGEGGGGLDVESLGTRNRISKVSGVGTAGGGGRVPEVHTVRQGDTLWDITGKYYKNSYLWPAVWSYNPQITNPHWIYPGDLVFLRSQSGQGLGGAGDASTRDLLGAFGQESGVMVMAAGYYTEEDLEGAGRIVFSPEEKRMITLLDEAWIDYADRGVRKKVPVGLRLAILHPMEAVIDPETDEEIAHKLVLVGTLQVVYNDGQTLPTGVITDAIQEIERGDLLLPLEDSLFRLEPTEDTRDQQARIIDAFAIATQFGEQQFVLVNRGAEDGVQVGNRFVVVERREGIYDLPPEAEDDDDDDDDEESEEERDERERQEKTYIRPGDVYWPMGEEPVAPEFPERECEELEDEDDDDDDDEDAEPANDGDDEDDEDDEGSFHCSRDYSLEDLPYRLIGEVIVVKTTEKFSTVLIIDSRREFNIGQEVVMFSGY